MRTSRIELTFEQRETWRVIHGNDISVTKCPFCQEDSPMIRAEDLANAFGISPRDIYRQIESGRLHFIENGDLRIMVCLSSYAQGTVDNEAIPVQPLAIGHAQ